jgi:transcriptional regulator with XRE-family HTH domain
MTVINSLDLTRAMDRAPMTASQLAREVGVSLTYICDIRAGRRKLSRNPALRRRIAEALGVPQHWIEEHTGR